MHACMQIFDELFWRENKMWIVDDNSVLVYYIDIDWLSSLDFVLQTTVVNFVPIYYKYTHHPTIKKLLTIIVLQHFAINRDNYSVNKKYIGEKTTN